MPIFAGTVYRVFGPTSVMSEIVLIAIALLFVGASVWAIDRTMKRLGCPAIARLGALAVFSLAPLNFSLEMENFRVWEGGVAAAGLAFALAYVLKKDGEVKAPGWREALLLAAGGGVMAMISPPTALAIYALLGLLAWRRRGVLAVPVVAALSLVLLIAVSYPWAVRNEHVFGEKVWSRTNFGFNYAQGFYDAAVAPKDPKAAFLGRLAELDPYTSRAAYERMVACRRRAGLFEALDGADQRLDRGPPRRRGADRGPALRGILLSAEMVLVGLFGKGDRAGPETGGDLGDHHPGGALHRLAAAGQGLAISLRPGRGGPLPVAPYVLAQPILQYRYPNRHALMTYLAAEFLWRLVARIMQPEKPSVSKSDTLVPEHAK